MTKPTSAFTSLKDGQRVVIAGFGPVGRCVADQLEQAGIRVTIIETNDATVQQQRKLDREAVLGDVTDARTLRAARIDQADALVLAVPDEEIAVAACALARQLAPSIFIAARTNFLSKGLLASRAGADEVIVEEVVTADAMRQAVVRRLLRDVDHTDGSGEPPSPP